MKPDAQIRYTHCDPQGGVAMLYAEHTTFLYKTPNSAIYSVYFLLVGINL